jgi:hypothetical protein
VGQASEPWPATYLGQLREVLVALEDGIGATAACVFDDDRAEMYVSTEETPERFWDAFRGMGCPEGWDAWYREVRSVKQFTARCNCGGQHVLHGALLHQRWVVMVISAGPQAPFAGAVVTSAARVIGDLLPPVRARRPPSPTGGKKGGGGESGRLGIPLWWARRRS